MSNNGKQNKAVDPDEVFLVDNSRAPQKDKSIPQIVLDDYTEVRKEISTRHKSVCHMHIDNLTNKEIAEALDLSEGAVSRILNTPLAQGYMADIMDQRRVELIDPIGKLKDAAMDAADTMIEVMKTAERPMDRLKGAEMVMKYGGFQPVEKSVSLNMNVTGAIEEAFLKAKDKQNGDGSK